MYSALKTALQNWNNTTNERQKLQHTYAVVVVLLVIAAGLVSLVNYQLSQNILSLVFGAVAVFIVNLIAWALLQSLVILPLEAQETSVKQKTSAKSRSTKR